MEKKTKEQILKRAEDRLANLGTALGSIARQLRSNPSNGQLQERYAQTQLQLLATAKRLSPCR